VVLPESPAVPDAPELFGIVLVELPEFGMLPLLSDGAGVPMLLPLFIEPLLPAEPLFAPLIDEPPELFPFMDEDGELLIEPLFIEPLLPGDPESCC
jgi:hypothetical protein